MFRLSRLFSLGFLLVLSVSAFAQDVDIQFPQEGQLVRGQITVRYSGIPDGGYAVIKIDNVFSSATMQSSFNLDTFPPTFSSDGNHSITVIGMNAGGKSVGKKTVSFQVANNKVETGGESVLLTHYVDAMRLESNVQRYRLFAESNATMEGGGSAGGAGPGGDAGGGAGESGAEWIKAPLDWQVSAMMRRIVRDVGMFSDTKSAGGSSANIRTVMQEAYQHQRLSESGGEKGGEGVGVGVSKPRRGKKKKGPPVKAPWKPEWEASPEIGQYFVKAIEPNGREINATHKAPTIALADLLPTFPDTAVRPGSTWETRMTFVGDLSSRQPVNVSVPITFTSFENVQTVSGSNRRTAKLESRFQMPSDLAKKMAINLVLQGGGSGVGGTETGAGASGDTGSKEAAKTWSTLSTDELQEKMDSVTTVRTSASRVLWFDIQNHRVIRAEDTINTYFEYEAGDGGGGAAVSDEGGNVGEVAAGPQKITYNLVVTTWLDDTSPAPTASYNGGSGTPHSQDNATDPTTERLIKP